MAGPVFNIDTRVRPPSLMEMMETNVIELKILEAIYDDQEQFPSSDNSYAVVGNKRKRKHGKSLSSKKSIQDPIVKLLPPEVIFWLVCRFI